MPCQTGRTDLHQLRVMPDCITKAHETSSKVVSAILYLLICCLPVQWPMRRQLECSWDRAKYPWQCRRNRRRQLCRWWYLVQTHRNHGRDRRGHQLWRFSSCNRPIRWIHGPPCLCLHRRPTWNTKTICLIYICSWQIRVEIFSRIRIRLNQNVVVIFVMRFYSLFKIKNYHLMQKFVKTDFFLQQIGRISYLHLHVIWLGCVDITKYKILLTSRLNRSRNFWSGIKFVRCKINIYRT